MQTPLPFSAVIGILGGGQLGRMLCLAAAEMGYKTHIFCPDDDCPATDVSSYYTCANYQDEESLLEFSKKVDVITYEFENVPLACVAFLKGLKPVQPDIYALDLCQDRLKEKELSQQLQIVTARWVVVSSEKEFEAALEQIRIPSILKTRRFGYDGKGQIRIRDLEQSKTAWEQIGRAPAILEAVVPFSKELSVIATRGLDGSCYAFDVTENIHKNHILESSHVPANIDDTLRQEACDIACRVAEKLNYVGTLAVEMFVVESDGKSQILLNEIAPRVHNSGHWTIEGANVSQFHQHIRAITGWPLFAPTRLHDCKMLNLVGDDVHKWVEHARKPSHFVHLYGKKDIRPGRKMGHVTIVQ